jgi:hypothetical protein
MDELHAAVSDLVETEMGKDPGALFLAVDALAHRIAGREPQVRLQRAGLPVPSPRLTEDWFC